MATILQTQGAPNSTTYTDAQYGDELVDVANLVRYVNTSRIAGTPTWTALNYIATTGTQSIGGQKTFTSTLISNLNFWLNSRIQQTVTNQAPAVGTTLTLNGATPSGIGLNPASSFSSTATPLLPAGNEGEIIHLYNVSAFTFTVSDNGTVAGTNLRLTATTLAIAPRQSLWLQYFAASGWVQVVPLVTVI